MTSLPEKRRRRFLPLRQSLGHGHQISVLAADGQGLSRQVTLTENDLEIVLKEKDGDKHLLATRNGKELFEGAINTDEERQAIPDVVKPLLERAEGGVQTQVLPSGKKKHKKKIERKMLSL